MKRTIINAPALESQERVQEKEFSYTMKRIPAPLKSRFNELVESGIIEKSTSFNTYLKRALLNQIKADEKVGHQK